jgi:hypothetical protein
MATSGWSTRALLVVLASLCVVLAGWSSPLIRAAGWRVFHPRGRMAYRGLQVLVPWPWITETDAGDADPILSPQGVLLKKTRYTAGHSEPAQTIFVTVISPDRGKTAREQTEGWMESFRTAHAGGAFAEMTVAGASCQSAAQESKPGEVVWTCISVEAGWVAGFEGYSSDAPDFFRVVTNLKR